MSCPPTFICRGLGFLLVCLACVWPAQRAQSAIEALSMQTAELKPGSSATQEAAAPRVSAGRNVLRCWQYGRLIYEGKGLIQSDKSAIPRLRAAGGGSVHFIDMQNGLCILEQSNG